MRLTMPAKVAFDLEGLQRTLADLAGRLGHPGCASGCDTLFLQHEREFTISETVELNPQPIPPGHAVGLPQDPVPWKPQIDVLVPERVSNNLESLQKAIANTLGKLGCAACCSGFDIAFRRELDLIAINDQAEVQGFGSFR